MNDITVTQRRGGDYTVSQTRQDRTEQVTYEGGEQTIDTSSADFNISSRYKLNSDGSKTLLNFSYRGTPDETPVPAGDTLTLQNDKNIDDAGAEGEYLTPQSIEDEAITNAADFDVSEIYNKILTNTALAALPPIENLTNEKVEQLLGTSSKSSSEILEQLNFDSENRISYYDEGNNELLEIYNDGSVYTISGDGTETAGSIQDYKPWFIEDLRNGTGRFKREIPQEE